MTFTPATQLPGELYAWPRTAGGHNMNRELIVKSTECKPCTAIGRNQKSVIPAKQFQPHIPCVEPNQENHIDFGGTFFDEKGE